MQYLVSNSALPNAVSGTVSARVWSFTVLISFPRVWTTKRICQQGVRCSAVWKTLLPSWKPCRWIPPATSGPQLVISFRPSLLNSRVFCLLRYDVWASETSYIAIAQNVLKLHELWITSQSGLLWIFPNDSADVSRGLVLLYLWSIPMFSVGNNCNSVWGYFSLLSPMYFLCPVSVRLEYCIWESQYLDIENPSGFNCWN